jgi:alkylation response protein AidB-like acyl-CoA dehydrogenase
VWTFADFARTVADHRLAGCRFRAKLVLAAGIVNAMNFDFSDDQKQFRDTVRRFLAERCDLSVPRRVLDGDEPYAAEVWKGLADLGVLGVAIPEAHGGLGLGALELCVIAEELGRALAPVPALSSLYLASEALLRFGSDAQKEVWLPKLANGSAIGSLAVSEGAQQAAPGNLRASFVAGRLNGTKVPVADGEAAQFAIVLAGGCLVLAELAGPGVTRQRVATLDPSRKYAKIAFSDCKAETLGRPGEGWAMLDELHTAAAVPLAFEQIGGAEAAMYMARDYALERHAFGKPIGAQQAIKHKLADMYIKLELARSNAYYGAMMLATRGADLPVAAAAARVAATEANIYAAQECVQVHGGIGFTWAADPQLHYRRARLLAHALGGPATWKTRLVAELEKKNTA